MTDLEVNDIIFRNMKLNGKWMHKNGGGISQVNAQLLAFVSHLEQHHR